MERVANLDYGFGLHLTILVKILEYIIMEIGQAVHNRNSWKETSIVAK